MSRYGSNIKGLAAAMKKCPIRGFFHSGGKAP